jgi:hypothetical protein
LVLLRVLRHWQHRILLPQLVPFRRMPLCHLFPSTPSRSTSPPPLPPPTILTTSANEECPESLLHGSLEKLIFFEIGSCSRPIGKQSSLVNDFFWTSSLFTHTRLCGVGTLDRLLGSGSHSGALKVEEQVSSIVPRGVLLLSGYS